MKTKRTITTVDVKAIRHRLVDKGWNVSRLAAATGYTRAYIHRILAQDIDVTTLSVVISAIAKALGMTVADVMGDKGLEESLPQAKKELDNVKSV